MSIMEITDNGRQAKTSQRLLTASAKPAAQKLPTLAIRVSRTNPNHHLWTNGRMWWLHFTVHTPNYTKSRVRQSLATSDISVARQRRDEFLAKFATKSAKTIRTTLLVSFFRVTRFPVQIRSDISAQTANPRA